MNSLEQLIRSALQKRQNPSAQTRQSIYASARAALDRTLDAREQLSPEQAQQSQQRLDNIIKAIEDEYVTPISAPIAPTTPIASTAPTAPPPPTAPAPPATPMGMSESANTPIIEPVYEANNDVPPSFSADVSAPVAPSASQVPLSTQHAFEPTNEAQFDANVETIGSNEASGNDVSSVEGQRRSKSVNEDEKSGGNYYSLGLSSVILVGFFVMAAWWLVSSGMLTNNSANNGEVANPAGTTDRGAPEEGRDWITVLAPTDIDKLIANASNSAKLVTVLDKPRLELTFGLDREPDGDFQLQVGRGVLAAFAGKEILIDLAMSGNDRTVPISVTCDFGSLGSCGRKRYSVPIQPDSLVFSVKLPSVEPDGAGSIKISGQGDDVMGATIALHGLYVAMADE